MTIELLIYKKKYIENLLEILKTFRINYKELLETLKQLPNIIKEYWDEKKYIYNRSGHILNLPDHRMRKHQTTVGSLSFITRNKRLLL